MVQHCLRGHFLSILPSPPSSWLPFPLTLQKALRGQIPYAEMPVWQEIIPFHCSATLSEQGTLAVGSTFQFSDYNTCVNVLEPGQPVCLYPTVSFVQFHCDHMGQKSPFTVSQCSLGTSLSVPCMISIEHSLLEK